MKHGHSPRNNKSPTYRAWRSMMQRCFRVKDKNYPYYGGRGITVCERWRTFADFLADMGENPAGATLDRIDSDGHYEPSNCRWADRKTQVRNRRNSVTLTHNGQTRTIAEWAEVVGINFNCLRRRVALGWSAERALCTAHERGIAP